MGMETQMSSLLSEESLRRVSTWAGEMEPWSIPLSCRRRGTQSQWQRRTSTVMVGQISLWQNRCFSTAPHRLCESVRMQPASAVPAPERGQSAHSLKICARPRPLPLDTPQGLAHG
jgi:hypothetical protein